MRLRQFAIADKCAMQQESRRALVRRRNQFNLRANARHHPPRIQRRQRQVLRMKAALFAVGCMPLLGVPLIMLLVQ
jgi:hypothetical protein